MGEKINIVWCDDHIDDLLGDDEEVDDYAGEPRNSISRLFKEKNCQIKRTTDAQELCDYLKKNSNQVDAVIIDLHLGKKGDPDDKEDIHGYIHIREHIDEYHETIPFYLYSGRPEIIDNLKLNKEDKYFKDRKFGKNNKEELNALLDMLLKEVEEVRKRKAEYKIKQEYSEAFQAIAEFSEAIVTEFKDKGFEKSAFTKPFIDILTGNIKKETGNTLRTLIEGVYSKYSHFVPRCYPKNAIPYLLSGGDKDSKSSTYYAKDDYMPKYLSYAFSFFLQYTNACSHPTTGVNLNLMKAVAIIGLELMRWAGEFKKKYNNLNTEFTAQIEDTNEDKEYIVTDEYKDTYRLQQKPSTDLQVGDSVKIKKMSADGNGGYYVYRDDWEPIKDGDTLEKTEDAPDVVTINPIEGKVQSANIDGTEILYVTSDDGQKYHIEEDNDRPNPIDANVKIEGHSGQDFTYKDYFFVPSSLWEFNYD